MTFKPRLTKPEAGNPYYNTIAAGGYSQAILGKPTDKGCNVLANCVGYAAGRFCEIIGKNCMPYFKCPPNAEDFYDTGVSQGLKVGTEPKLGAIIVWAKGKTWTSSDGAGHVAVVEEIRPDGSIVTSESGYGCSNPFWTQHRYKESGNWGQGSSYRFLGFVYQPETPIPAPKPETPGGYIRKGDNGSAVVWLQERLKAAAEQNPMYDPGNVDGDFGDKTERALVYYQFKHGLAVDGVAGPVTQAALAK